MAHSRILSFKYALEGIYTALKEEPNLKLHVLAMATVIVLGVYFDLMPGEWMAVILSIGLVIALELTNTAIETIVDSFTSDTHPGAKKAKDVASGAVLIIAITASLIGLLVFLPHIIKAFTH
jgi:undecaprenol kinase